MRSYWILKILKWAAIIVAAIFGFGYLFMLLWNAIIPSVFGMPELTFWTAIGLLLIAKLLFGGFRSGHHRHGHKGGWWRYRLQKKMAGMSPEEREEFKKSYFGKCGYGYKDESSADEVKV